MNPRTYPTRAAWHAATRRQIIRKGLEPIQAYYDPAGNCRICGEAGRCPGWHYYGEKNAVFKVDPAQQPTLPGYSRSLYDPM